MDRVDVEQWKGREVARLLALVETERRYYQEIIAALPVGLAVVSRDGAIQSANRAFRHTFGLKSEDVRRRTVDQLLPGSGINEALSRTHVRGTAASGNLELNVSGRRLRASFAPIRDWDEDSELEVLLVLEDLEDVPPPVFDAPALIWLAKTDSFEFRAIHEQHAPHPGFSADQIHSGDRKRVLDYYRHAFRTPGTYACEYRADTADGGIAWYRDAFRVTGPEASGVVTEITSRKQAEQIALNSGRLDALAGLAKSLTHDLNNPLMIVTGYGEELMAGLSEADPRRGEMSEILSAAHRMAAMSNQLLAFTRKQAHSPSEVSVAEAVAHAIGSETIKTRVPPTLQALADTAQLAEAFRAILSRLHRDGRISVEAHRRILSEQLGDGLPAGDYAEIVFHSASPVSISFEALLTGKDPLGADLARAHALVHEWGGGIWQSGNSVHIMLPAGAPVEEQPAAPATAEAPAAPESPAAPVVEEPQLETILVVEDEGGIRALVRKILRRQKYGVLEAGTPDEAIQVAANHTGKIDLLITDMTLPQRNGRALAEELSAKIPGLKVLYVSGYTDDTSLYEGDLPSGAAFLQKPFTLGSLLKKVRDVLDA